MPNIFTVNVAANEIILAFSFLTLSALILYFIVQDSGSDKDQSVGITMTVNELALIAGLAVYMTLVLAITRDLIKSAEKD